MKNKKSKKKNYFTIIISLIIFISGLIYFVVDLVNFYKNYEIDYSIETYENDPSNQNLIALVNILAVKYDERLFNYIDDYLNMDNYNSEIRQCEPNPLSDKEVDYYHDAMITLVFRTCARNNNLDLFMESLNKYYPQIRNKDKFFFLALANKGEGKETKFFEANAEKIVEYLENIYASTDIPKEKWKTLILIATYYSSEMVNDIDTYTKKHKDELVKMKKQFVDDSNGETFGYYLAYQSSYWDHLMTGAEDDYWNSALNHKMEKAEITSDDEIV